MGLSWLIGTASGLVAAWGLLRYFEWRNLYLPSRRISYTPADSGLEYEEVEFVAEDACVLHGWWIPVEDAIGTILHCHGNAGNIGDRVVLAADLTRLQCNVFLFDYRGYGMSRGWPTEQGTYADARAAFEVVRARLGDSETPPVIVHGQSLGGAVAIHLALEKPVRGLIVEGTFTSIRDMARWLYPGLPLHHCLRFKYDAASKIARVRVPKLIAHSRADEVVPFEMGRRLYDLAPAPKEFFALQGSHSEAGWATTPAYWEVLQRFVVRCLSAEPAVAE